MSELAFVTGGSRGIGASIVKALANKGYRVVFTYNKNENQAMQVCKELNDFDIQCIKLDVSDYKSAYTIIKGILEENNRIDVLVNNAGVSSDGLFTDMTPEEWDNVFNVNVKGVFNVTKPVAQQMVRQHYGRIINISSMWGQVGASYEVAYSASKAAVIGFSKALAKELAPSGITVNCICPGVISTDMLNVYSDEDISMLIEETPVGRIGKPDDIAKAVCFFASKEADFITGQVLGVNGGFVI